MPNGIILKGIGGFYYVKSEDTIYECKARGIFRKDDMAPLPGDLVNISISDTNTCIGNIDTISPRQSQLIRPAVANVTQVAVVLAVKSPAPDLVLIDKLLITAELKKISAIVCVNKADLDTEENCKKIIEPYEKAGYKVVLLSSKADMGFDKLEDMLRGKVTVFAGQSGVGKSTILNKLMNSEIMETGSVSGKIERGKHTTRHAELIELGKDGYVVDTPGFSSFELSDISHETIELYYPEFSEYLNKCKFTRCSHISEPECTIKEALNNGFIDRGRYDRYIQFYNILKQNKVYKNKSRKEESKR